MADLAMSVALKRAYEPPVEADGRRVLVDRLWPRGVAKNDARLTLWLKEVAPSPELRRWFGHDPARWTEFVGRYRVELDRNPEPVERLRALAAKGRVTLVYGARDPVHNHAAALRAYLVEGEPAFDGD